MKKIYVYGTDLKEEKQKEIRDALGDIKDEPNWDAMVIAILTVEIEEGDSDGDK